MDWNSASPLSLIELPSGTFQHDLDLFDRYRSFSVELLRLSLLGIGGIGFFIKESYSTQSILSSRFSRISLVVSIGCLGVSSAFALINQRFTTNCLAIGLFCNRLHERNAENDRKKADAMFRKLDLNATGALMGLTISCVALALGTTSLALSLIWAILHSR